MTALEARKQLLVLESDLNRAQLITAVHDWKLELHRSTGRVMRLALLASTATKVAGIVSTVRRLVSRRGTEDGKKSWLPYLVDGFSVGTSLWQILRGQRGKRE